ncbi:DUF1513 domain-containing protein [Dongia rigui]|uniref:DUF1513 domain-containing protein n=1 Tax=Dongia rigui TaxID=940149 RepID=A0ABU5E4G3_9PROT|nr:DUF1513 domain-containing protein [Dongia rigui]MDY0874374.1 DUF1513 domain-containing protein [Dongia rigui]
MSIDRFLKRRAQALDHRAEIPAHLLAVGDNAGGKATFAAIAVSDSGRQVWRQALGWRAHDVIADPAREICAIIGRKPGHEALLCDLASGEALRRLHPLPGCTFDGHAVFSGDGANLYTTQSQGKAQIGHVVIYDVASGAIAHSFSSQGIEPHELLWADAKTLAIGNGGILDRNSTDPITSSLVWLDAATGDLLGRVVLDEDNETLSLRHIARLGDGRVVCGVQDQDFATGLRPLVFLADSAGRVTALDLPAAVHRRLMGYIGSVAVDPSGAYICATSPRGGLAVVWSAIDGHYIDTIDLPDTCGAAGGPGAGDFLLSSGHGARLPIHIDPVEGIVALPEALRLDPLQWDNHLSLVRG